ncbi:MAG: type II CAAX endopeptidase family protein [Sphingomicrobium sp.]
MSEATTDKEPSAGTRPWWRQLIEFPLVAMVIAIATVMGTVAVAFALVNTLLPNLEPDTRILIIDVVAVVGLFLAYKLVIRHLGDDKRDELPAKGAIRDTAIGLGYGFGLFTVIVLAAAALGVYRIEGFGGTGGLLGALIADALFPGVSEEILFRGIIFRWVERFAGTWAGLIVSSALFGAAHLANPAATWTSTVFIAVEAGVLLGGVYMLTRNLWVAIGLHAAWNFTQGGIFGVPVSGLPENGLIDSKLTGPELLSGGPFGLEASIIALTIATGAGIWFVVRAIRAGRVVGPMWVEARKPAARIAPEA